MRVLRTPEERFDNLPDYPFKPNYLSLSDFEGGELRFHYLDEGKPGGATVLLLHGEPTWSYLYRHMIPPLVRAGFRVVAPDLIGFGKSDKPAQKDDYTYARHIGWLKAALFNTLDLTEMTLFCQDWGSLLGLRLSDGDPITKGGEQMFQTRVPGAQGQPHVTIAGGGHFLQEDKPDRLARLITEFSGAPHLRETS